MGFNFGERARAVFARSPETSHDRGGGSDDSSTGTTSPLLGGGRDVPSKSFEILDEDLLGPPLQRQRTAYWLEDHPVAISLSIFFVGWLVALFVSSPAVPLRSDSRLTQARRRITHSLPQFNPSLLLPWS
jgi:hypothetical protein